MRKAKFIHIMTLEKFNPSFIEFVKRNFDIEDHKFFFLGKENYKYGLKKSENIIWLNKKVHIFKFLSFLNFSKKIILHGLWDDRIIRILLAQPWLLKKSYWVMWGGDFYFPEKQTNRKKKIIKKMGNLLTYIEGDYKLAKEWYGATGKFHYCFVYPSNLYKEYRIGEKNTTSINVLLGNSADPTNNHFEILDKLTKYKTKDIKIYTPLSYGNKEYAEHVIREGKKNFGENFIPLREFLPFDEYLKLLAEIDIAIFNHNRQQAMGNIITLLGLGKKVYIRDDITTWDFFKKLQITVFSSNKNINLEPININVSKENIQKIKNHFGEENLKKQLFSIFYS